MLSDVCNDGTNADMFVDEGDCYNIKPHFHKTYC